MSCTHCNCYNCIENRAYAQAVADEAAFMSRHPSVTRGSDVYARMVRIGEVVAIRDKESPEEYLERLLGLAR